MCISYTEYEIARKKNPMLGWGREALAITAKGKTKSRPVSSSAPPPLGGIGLPPNSRLRLEGEKIQEEE